MVTARLMPVVVFAFALRSKDPITTHVTSIFVPLRQVLLESG
jgi:hypothetical protein